MSGPTINSITKVSNNINVNWSTPIDVTFDHDTIYLLSNLTQFDGSNPPTSVAPGTSENGYIVSTSIEYVSSTQYSITAGTYTITDVPQGTYYVLVLSMYNTPTRYVGVVSSSYYIIPSLTTNLSIPDSISVTINPGNGITFLNKPSLYNNTYPASVYVYCANDVNTGQIKTVNVPQILDSNGNQQYLWRATSTDNNDDAILLFGHTYNFSFSSLYSLGGGNIVSSNTSDVVGPYIPYNNFPDTPSGLSVVFGNPSSSQPGVYNSATITWDTTTNSNGVSIDKYLVSFQLSYSGDTVDSTYITVSINPNTFDNNKYVIDCNKYKNSSGVTPFYKNPISYNFKVKSKSGLYSSSEASISVVPQFVLNQVQSIQSVGIYSVSPPAGSFSMPIVLAPKVNPTDYTPTYYLVYWSTTSPPTVQPSQLISNKQYYSGFSSYGATYDSSGYINGSIVYINGGFPTNTQNLFFGVTPVFSYIDSSGNNQTINGNVVWTNNVSSTVASGTYIIDTKPPTTFDHSPPNGRFGIQSTPGPDIQICQLDNLGIDQTSNLSIVKIGSILSFISTSNSNKNYICNVTKVLQSGFKVNDNLYVPYVFNVSPTTDGTSNMITGTDTFNLFIKF